MKDKVKLELFAIGEIIGTPDVGLISLHDENRKRCLAIVCDNLMKEELQLRTSKQKVCRTMIPEVLSNVLINQTGFHFELVINDVVDGVYRAMLVNKDTFQPVSLRASDAVLLHLASGIPLYATTQLMQRQSVAITGGPAQMVPMPFNALSDRMLRDAMNAAVEQERYEVASTIRDELKRRGSKLL